MPRKKSVIDIDAIYEEIKELRDRRLWLLWQNESIKQDFREVVKGMEDFQTNMLASLSKNQYQLLRWVTIRQFEKTKEGRTFLHKYGLTQRSDDWLFTLRELQIMANKGNWGTDNTAFWLHAWWYQMKEDQNITHYHEIASKTDKKYSRYVNLRVLGFWRFQEPEEFRELCNLAKCGSKLSEQTGNHLLWLLGRLKVGVGRIDTGPPATEYPPVDGGDERIQTGRKYYVPCDYDFEYPERLFDEFPVPDELRKELKPFLQSFEKHREDYLAPGSDSSIENTIENAVIRMRKRIKDGSYFME